MLREELTISQIHIAMKEGAITAKTLTQWYLDRIEKYDKKDHPLNAMILVNPHALQQAEELDRQFQESGLTGPLHGIPVLLKDNVETIDMPTTAGSLSLKGWNSGGNATITEKLLSAGAVIIGKTNLHEFAVWGETVSSILGPSYNPYDYSRTPGGSSGGTGAGTAANFGVVGIGTDTINSIRSPASACGLVGIRPTIGLVSRFGIVPYSLTQDTPGPICRTVEDSVRTLEVLAGADSRDPITETSQGKIPTSYLSALKKDGVQGKKIGVLTGFFGKGEINRPVNKVMVEALAALKEQGAMLADVNQAFDSSYLVGHVSLHLHDLKTDLNDYLASFGDKIPVHSISEILESGLYAPNIEANFKEANTLSKDTAEYSERLEKRKGLQASVLKIMDELELDALVYPHQQQLVCKIGASQLQRNGVLASVTGYPAITVPAGQSEPTLEAPLGVPVGIEFFGRPFSEATLIEIAYGFEQNYSKRVTPQLKE